MKSAKRQTLIDQRLKQIPATMQELYKKAVAGNSKSLAIKAFCYECTGWDRAAVRECTALACPLWPYRPGGGRSKRPLSEAQRASISRCLSSQKRRSQTQEG